MASMGLLGALSGGGQGTAQIGEIMLKNNLEELRQQKLAVLQDVRDDKQFEQQKSLKGMEFGQRDSEKASDSMEKELDRQNRLEVAGIEAKSRENAASSKSGDSAAIKMAHYLRSQKNPDGTQKYSDEQIDAVASGAIEIIKDDKTGVLRAINALTREEVFSLEKAPGSSRRDPKVLKVPTEPTQGGLLDDEPKPGAAKDYSSLWMSK